MNLKKLFEVQKALRDRINYNEPDRFNKLVLALLVELGECANEWRGFKFWSKNQEPRTEINCHACDGRGVFDQGLTTTIDGVVTAFNEPCLYCEGKGVERFPLLEEYVDGLRFVLELGLEVNAEKVYTNEEIERSREPGNTIEQQFMYIYHVAGSLERIKSDMIFNYLICNYIYLGEMLGFTWEQIEAAYLEKNAENHARQERGY